MKKAMIVLLALAITTLACRNMAPEPPTYTIGTKPFGQDKELVEDFLINECGMQVHSEEDGMSVLVDSNGELFSMGLEGDPIELVMFGLDPSRESASIRLVDVTIALGMEDDVLTIIEYTADNIYEILDDGGERTSSAILDGYMVSISLGDDLMVIGLMPIVSVGKGNV